MAPQISSSSIRNSSASQQDGATSSSSAVPKTLVELNIAGLPTGANSQKFMTKAGVLIRRHVPINFVNWRIVPQKFKDDVWIALMTEYEFDVEHVRSTIEVKFPNLYRKYKSDLRKYHIRGLPRKKATKKRSAAEMENGEPEPEPELDEENEEGEEAVPEPDLTEEQWDAARLKVPDGMNTVVWEEFIDNERKEGTVAKCKQNSVSRSKSTVRHTLGRQSYSTKAYKLENSDVLAIPENTTDMWLKGHQRKDGSIHPSAVEAYEKVTQAKLKWVEMGESSSGLVSPALEEVFGHCRKDGIRGYSSSVSKKQADMAAIAKSTLKRKDTIREERLSTIEGVVSTLAGTVAAVQGQVVLVNDKFDVLMDFLKKQGGVAPLINTPSPEKGSASFTGVQKGHVQEKEVSASVSRVESTNMDHSGRVELLNNMGKVVAAGVIVSGGVVHNRKLKPNEKKVFIEQVFDQRALIWDGPQGDNWVSLSQVPVPTWLVWSEERLRPWRNEE